MIKINLEEAKRLVAECIAERGEDYTYEKEDYSCMYVHNAQKVWDEKRDQYVTHFENAVPGCIVGLAFHKAGVALEDMGIAPRNTQDSFDLSVGLAEDGILDVDPDAEKYLNNLQLSQDGGAPWGASAEAAERGVHLAKVWEDGIFTGRYKDAELW